MFVVLRHCGEWSFYSCNVIGVYETQELAERAIDEVLAIQIEKLKVKLQRDLQFYTKEFNDPNTCIKEKESYERHIERSSNDLRLLIEGKYTVEREKGRFEILNLDLNQTRRYEDFDDDNEDQDDNDMIINQEFSFETDIYIREEENTRERSP